MQSPNLSGIIEKAIAGDQQAFRMLVEKNQAFVYSLSYRLLGNSTDAEDITQETFIRLWRNLARYRMEIKLTTWLYKITTNLCLDLLKSKRRKQDYRTDSVDHEMIADRFVADQALMNEEFRLILLKMTEVLTPRQKAVFVLRDIEGLEVKEVCEILSIGAGNVKSNLYYSRIKMSQLIKQYYQEQKPSKL